MSEKKSENNLRDGLLFVMAAAMLVSLGVLADVRCIILRADRENKKAIEELHREFTRYITTGECGQFLDNKNQLREVVSK